MVVSRWARTLFVGLLLGAAVMRPVLAQESAAVVAPLRFAIHSFKIENNTLLPQEAIDQALAPFLGEGRDFGTVQQALEALEALYDARGFSVVRVHLPEQVLERGEVVFRVVEGRLRQLRFEGQSHFDVENIRNSLPSLKEGTTPDIRDITDNLRLVNENPAKQVTVRMHSGDNEGDVVATVETKDKPPDRMVMFLDNTGTESSGSFRTGIAGQHANFFNKDHVVSAQIVTSPDNHAPDVLVAGLGYHAPIYSADSSADFYYGYSSVNSGTVPTAAGTYDIAGKGTVVGLRFNKNLPKGKTLWDQRISVGLDSRYYENTVLPIGAVTSLVPDILIFPASLTYSATLRGTTSEFSGYFSYVHDFYAGTTGVAQYFTRLRRGGSKNGADIFRYGVNWSRVLPADWQVRFKLSGQETTSLLVTGEQFGIGGVDSVRGMLEREAADDKGYQASLDFFTPDWGNKFSADLRARGVLFTDIGYLTRLKPGPLDRAVTTASTVGFGVRGNWGKHLGFRLDFGLAVDKAGENSRDSRLHGAVTWEF
jgi:hemolysin activation/secretion protein